MAEVVAPQLARAAKAVAARAELGLEVEAAKKLPAGGGWSWVETVDEACRQGGTGWYKVTIPDKEAGVEGKETSPSPPMSGWVGGSP